ncbi:MAG: sensor domain-containing diguanylate cyclase [Myxococcales bacterium]|jgi:diguanylate cyclase (GGDEF)-like protein|nr:sensor domain-containing diguanylate cyclase [Myxococcales bacterium]
MPAQRPRDLASNSRIQVSKQLILHWFARHFPALAALAALGLVASGALRAGQTRPPLAWSFLALVVTCCTLAIARRVRRTRRCLLSGSRGDLEDGVLALGTSVALLQPWPGLSFPFLCGLTACLAALLTRRESWILTGFSIALLFTDSVHGLTAASLGMLSFQTALLVGFAALSNIIEKLTQARRASAQRAEAAQVEDELHERTRRYRLLDRTNSTADLQRWVSDSVREVDGAVGAVLDMAETALRTHTCAAFLLSDDGAALELCDCRSASDLVRRDAIPAGEGVLGAVLKQRAPVRLSSTSLQGVNYYTGKAPPLHAVLALPIFETRGERALRGVLVADRLDDLRTFSAADERLLTVVAAEVLRAIEAERLLTWFKQANDEKERLYSAIEALNQTTKTVEALGVALERAKLMARLDFAALTLVRDEPHGKRRHQVVCATLPELENRSFADNAGLVSNVVRYGAALPERELSQMDRPVVFDEEMTHALKGLRALRIFPLRAGDRIVGTIAAGRQSGPRRFDQETLRALEVLSIQAAQSVLRAELFDQMEQLATTDGLTGLVNHRTFQARCDEALQLAQRYGKKVSLMLTDIDHFKRVNDTYGHPAGDHVLRGVARILRESARDTDIVARYGGEEFCVIMPETDAVGAKVIAERLRQEIEAAVFDTEAGPLKVTLSLGIATYPESAAKKQELIDLADQCLYFAKQHGRNQSVTVAQMQRGREEALSAQR